MLVAGKILSLLLSVFIPVVMLAAQTSDPAYSAAASVEPAAQYLNDAMGTLFTFSVHNTGTSALIGAVTIEPPSSSWTIVACPQAPAGWTAELADGKCRYRSAITAADDIQPGQKIGGFQLRATAIGGNANHTGMWKVAVSKSNQLDNESLLTAAAEPPGLIAMVYSWEVLDAVVASEPATPGSDCPSPSKQAISGSTVAIVICGRNRTNTDLEPAAALSSLSGTFVASPGTFSSGLIGKETTGSVVLGNWTGVQVTSPSGPDKAVIAAIASATYRTSPPTALTGYEAKNKPPIAADDNYSVDEDSVLNVSAPGVLANDRGPNGEPLSAMFVNGLTEGTGTAALVSGPTHGTLVLNADGSFTYAPAANFNGPDSFTYKARDTFGAESIPATVYVTVNPTNDVPNAENDSYDHIGDVTMTVSAPGVLANDTDVENNPLTAVLITGPAHGTLSLDANGSFSYTPSANYSGSDSFTYKANDGDAGSNVATVTISINAAPVAEAQNVTTGEDTPQTITLTGSDAEDAALVFSIVTGPAHGTLGAIAAPDCSPANSCTADVTYTPAPDYNGADSFAFRVNDGDADSNLATVTISVNAAPMADNQNVTTGEDTPQTITLTGSDAEDAALVFSIVTGPAHGTLGAIAAPDCSPANSCTADVTYTPAPDYNGPDSFAFRVNDGAIDSEDATVSITVSAVNDVPGAMNDSYATDEDTELTVTSSGVLTNDGDIDGDSLTAVLVTGPAHGTLTLNSNGSFTYTPDANYNGDDSFTYQANDGTAGSNVATVSLTIDPVNDAPVAADDSYSTDEDTPLNVAAAGVQANDTDVESSPLTAVLVAGPAHGTLTLSADGSFDYTPDVNFNGNDSFTYQANDGDADSNAATVNITVNPINDVPVAANDSYLTNEDVTLAVNLPGILANDTDVDGDPLVVVPITAPAHGVLLPLSDGSFTYIPGGNYNGPDSFTYQANDGTASSNIATVSLTVDPVNDAPVAANDAYGTDEDTPLTVAAAGVLANDTDVESGPLTAVLVAGPAHGTLTLNANGSFDYTPDANFSGSDSFTYQANNGDAGSNVATVRISINAAPVAGDQNVTTSEDTPQTITLTGSDAEDAPLAFSIVTGPAHGTLGAIAAPDCSPANSCTADVTYTPAPDYNGADSFTFKVNDGAIDSEDATVSITVNAVNDAPTAVPDSFLNAALANTLLSVGVTTTGQPVVNIGGNLLANDTDQDGDTITAVAETVTSTGDGTATINSNGSFTFLPGVGDKNQTDTFTYHVTDGIASTAGTVTMIIAGSRVWYVNNTASGDGRSTGPFATLGAAETASGAGDIIFVYEGNSTTTPYGGGIVLKDGQKLYGEGIGLTVPDFGTLVPAGHQPRINNTGGDAVSVPATTGARTNVEIRGLDLQGTGNAVDVTASGANVVGVTISDNNIRGAGLEGVDLNAGSTGSFAATVQTNAIASTGNGIDARTSAAGPMYLALNSNTGIASGAYGIIVDGSGGVTTMITAFSDNTVSGNTVGTGISITSATFDLQPGAPFQTVLGGTTAVGASGNGVGAAGVVLTNVAGSLAFTDLDIYADGGVGLRATGAAAGMSLSVGAGVGNVAATGGPAVDLTSIAATLPFQTITSTNSPTTGVALNSVTGSVSAGSGSISNITSAAGTAFQMGSSSATVSYAGTINTTAGKGVSFTSNTGSLALTGALILSTGATSAFEATGGGTISSSDTTSTLATTTGTALNVTNTTIAAAGLKFRSISAGTEASGPTNAIVLNNTGASGGLTVLGTGSSPSGGTIQRTTGHGIALNNAANVSFTNMNIQNTGGSGINGTGVTNFTFTNGTINNSGDAVGESNISFNGNGALSGNNLNGTLSVTNSTLTNAFDCGIHIENSAGTISNATITGNTITSLTSTATSKGDGIRMVGTGDGSAASNLTKATISGNTIRNFPSGGGIQVNYGNASASGPSGSTGTAGSGTNIVSITNNTVGGFDATNRLGTSAIAIVTNGGNSGQRGQGNFDVSNNGTVAEPIGNSLGTVILVGNNGYATMTATVNNNVIVANNTFASNGIGGGNGIVASSADTPDLTLTATGNSISQVDGNGILLVGRGVTGMARFKIQNNTVAAPLTGVRPGIRVDAGNGASVDDAVCLNISGNTSAGSGGSQGIGLRKQGTAPATNDFGINGMAATSSPGIEAYVDGLNPADSGTLLISAISGFTNCSLP